MRTHLMLGACVASCLVASASGAAPLFATNPTRINDHDPNLNDAGLLGIGFDSGMTIEPAGGNDQGLKGSYVQERNDFGGANTGGLASIDDGFGNRIGGSGHAPDLSTDNVIAAAGSDQNPDTNDAGAVAPS